MLIAASLILVARPASSDGPDPPPPTITLKDFPESHVVYKVETGPYWTLGRSYAEIGRILADHPDAGPMYGEYLDDPDRTRPSDLRTEVGFFAPPDFDVPPGYRTKTDPAYRAATLIVEGPYASTSQHHRRIRDWLTSNGYTPADETIEIYPNPSGANPVIEIRVPVKFAPTDQPAVEQQSVPDEPVVAERRESAPLDQLLKAGAYARVAARIIPAPAHVPASHRKWLAEVADRLRVIREIVDTRYAGEAARVHELLTPIVERAARPRRVTADDNGPPDPPVSPLTKGGLRRAPVSPLTKGGLRRAPVSPLTKGGLRGVWSPEFAGQKTATLKSLDRLMVQTHLKKLTATAIYDALIVTLTDVDRILSATAELRVPDKGAGGRP